MSAARDPYQDLPEPPEARTAERPTFDPFVTPRPRRQGPQPVEPDVGPSAPGVSEDPGAEPGSDDAPLPWRSRVPRWAYVVSGLLLVLATLGATAFFLLRGSTANLVRRVPAGAEAVVVVSLDPSASQKLNIARLADAVPGAHDLTDVAGMLEEWSDDTLDRLGVDYEAVTGWLGSEVALVVDESDAGTDVALLADVADRDGAKLMIAKLSAPRAVWAGVEWIDTQHLGVTVAVPSGGPAGVPSYAYDGDALIVASDPAFVRRIIDTTRGARPSIQSVAPFREALVQLPTTRLVTGWVHGSLLGGDLLPGVAAETASALGGLGDLSAVRSIAVAMWAEPDGVALDVVASYDAANLTGPLLDQVSAADHENPLLEMVPADAWSVFAGQHVDLGLGAAIDELRLSEPRRAREIDAAGITGPNGLLELMTGDLALAVRPGGDPPFGGALIVGIDEDARAPAIERIATGIGGLLGGAPSPAGGWEEQRGPGNVEIHVARDLDVAYAVRDEVLVVGTSAGQVAAVLATAEDVGTVERASFVEATSELRATDALFHLDLREILRSLRDGVAPKDRTPLVAGLPQELGAVRSISLGIDADTDRERIRVFVEVPPEDEDPPAT